MIYNDKKYIDNTYIYIYILCIKHNNKGIKISELCTNMNMV